jgi:hypothetical protein
MDNEKEVVSYTVTIHYVGSQKVLTGVLETVAQALLEWYDGKGDESFEVNSPQKKSQFRRENILFVDYVENHS